MRTLRWMSGLCMILLVAVAPAHELQANRATLVLRDQRHLTLTLYIDYTLALHRALAPKVAFAEFVAVHAAMTPAEFQAELNRAQARFEAGTQLALPDGAVLVLSQWTWPEASALQAALQQRAMQLIVAPEDHAHSEALEIHAEATAPVTVDTVSLSLAPEFGQVLVVWYRPQQIWAQPEAGAVTIQY